MGVENFKRTVGRNFIVSIISVIFIFTFIKSPKDLPIYVLIITGTSLIGNLSLWPYLRKEIFAPKWKTLALGHHLKPTLLLFLPQIATQIYTIANKTMIGIFDGKTASGFFSQSDNLIKVTLSIVTSLGVVMLPHVSNLFSKGKIKEVQETLKKSFVFMTGLAIPIMFGVMGIALNFAGFFFGPKWVAVGPLLMMEAPIIVFIAWSNVLGIQYLLPLNRMREFTTSVTIGAVLNILLNFVLIPSLGLTGAMIATVIAEAAVTIYQFYILRNDFEIGTMILSCWKYFLSGAIMFGVVFYLNNLWKMNFRNLLFQIVIGAIIYIILNILLKTSLFIEVKKIVSKK